MPECLYKREKNKTCKNIDFIAVGSSFLQMLKDKKYSEKTINTYRYPLQKFFSFLADIKIERIQNVGKTELDSYRASLLAENITLGGMDVYTRALKLFFRYLEEEGYIFDNPAKYMERIRVEKKLPVVPTVAEINKLISVVDMSNNAGLRDRAIVETAYSTALRCNELVSLNLLSIDIKNALVQVMGKGRKERRVPLGRQAVFYLGKYIETARNELLHGNIDQKALWISNMYAKRMSDMLIQKMFQRYAEKAGLKGKITVHSIRRACATHMLQNGAHPVQIQMLLGHTQMRHLSQYLKLTITDIMNMHKKSKVGK